MRGKMILFVVLSAIFLAIIIRPSASAGPNPDYTANSTSVAAGTQYSPGAGYGFQTNWTDGAGVSTVLFETDLNSSLVNYTVGCSGASTNVLCVINFTDLPAGSYRYRWIANNTADNFNYTDAMQYSIAKNSSAATSLFLNGTQGNRSYGQNQAANFTASMNISGKTVYLDSNYTGWALQSGAGSSLMNYTTLSSAGNNFNLTAYWNGDANYTSSSKTYFFNVTAAYLEVSLASPGASGTTSIVQNQTFTINATVYCRGGNCGHVNGTVMYNLTLANPDTPVNTSQGDNPFYVQESPASAMKPCPSNPLSQDQFCNIAWTVNATGAVNSGWKIGALFNSSYASISNNNTGNATVSIVSCVVDITTQFSGIDFGTLTPSTGQNPASGNSGMLYNITINPGSCDTDLYTKSTDLSNTSLGSCCNAIGAGNMTFGNSTNSYGNSFNFTASYQVLKTGLAQGQNMTTYYWLNVPAVYAGGYSGSVVITGVKSGDPSP